MSDTLNQLLEACACGVHITVNEHRNLYMTAAEYLTDLRRKDDAIEAPEDVLNQMVETNTIVEVQAYPDTPVGFYHVWHWDLETAIETVLEAVLEGRGAT